jgi:peptidoglycan hydrolase-like amidase
VRWLLSSGLLALAISAAAADLDHLAAEHFHIRVRLGDAAHRQTLEPHGECVMLNRAGEVRFQVPQGRRLVITCPEWVAAPPTWRVVLGEFGGREKTSARALAARMRETANLPTEIVEIRDGEDDYPRQLLVTFGQFGTRGEAETHRATLGSLVPVTRVWHDERERHIGRLRVSDRDGDEIGRFWEQCTLLPADEETTVAARVGDQWRTFRGRMICRVDDEGKILLIDDLLIEDYLASVVAQEIGDAPPAAMQAQAIVCRSEALHKVDTFHHRSPFYDLCDTTHCQVFHGIAAETAASRLAARDTRGMVLMSDGDICDAVYCDTCGGVTGSESEVWMSDGSRYLVARLDAEDAGPAPDLSSESAVRHFLDHPPDVMCNPEGHSGFPPYARQHFRWAVHCSPDQLDGALGGGLGEIRSVEVTQRGRGGRVMELRIRGSDGSTTLEKTSEIRAALTDLQSSLFVVDEERDAGGRLTGVRFHGGGWGHGVGMCQTGAFMRALAGQSCSEILRAYFPGTELRRIY